ncbi:Uncharacterised protein [Klebsiella pneumoniae]|nr:Uncharacterised protein [Klebsiella pneumoniae]
MEVQLGPNLSNIQLTFLQGNNIQTNATAWTQNAAIILSGQHQHCKTGELCGTVVDVQTENIVFQNQLRNITGTVAAFFVNRFQHVIGFGQDMAGAAGRVQHLDTFRFNAGWSDGSQLRLHFWRLLRRLNVVRHFAFQAGVRVDLQPLATHRVLHQVLHNPVRGKQLSGGWNIFALHHLADHIIFFLGNIKLIQPADHFDLFPVFVRNGVHQPTQNRVGTGQVIRQYQLNFIIDCFEQERHCTVQRMTLGQQQFAIQLFVTIARQLHLHQTRFVQPKCISHFRHMVQNLKTTFQRRVRQHTETVIKIAMQLHIANSAEAVKPGVSNVFHQHVVALLFCSFDQTLTA